MMLVLHLVLNSTSHRIVVNFIFNIDLRDRLHLGNITRRLSELTPGNLSQIKRFGGFGVVNEKVASMLFIMFYR
jgi:hypothetical protein